MIWQNPFAWLGLAVLGVPVLLHLFSRRQARVEKFPSLRFLERTNLTPTRRTRLTDLLLLAVRLAILLAAVAALAQPFLLTSGRTDELGRTTARAVIVDTSASMSRATPSGETGVAVARREGARLAGEAATSAMLETGSPTDAIGGAVAWLATQPGKHELVIVSDFQVHALVQDALSAAPTDVGVRLWRVDLDPAAELPGPALQVENGMATARADVVAEQTRAEWTLDAAPVAPNSAVQILAGASERAGANAARSAALAMGVPRIVEGHPLAIVFPRYEQRDQLLRDAKPIDERWMGDVIARIHADGLPVGVVKKGSVEGRDGLLLFTEAEAGSVASAALIASTWHALANEIAAGEMETATVSADTLAKWERPPSSAAPARASNGTGQSDGRWLWMVALVLLAAEALLRRRARSVLTPVSAA